jgi:hypothetical protein
VADLAGSEGPASTGPATAYAEVQVYAGRVRAQSVFQGELEVPAGQQWSCAELRSKGRLEGEFLGADQQSDLVGRPELRARIRAKPLGDFLLTVPIEATDTAQAVQQLKPGDAVSATFTKGKDALWLESVEGAERPSEDQAGAWFACDMAFAVLSGPERSRLAERLGGKSDPRRWRETAQELTARDGAGIARTYALRLLADRLDERSNGPAALSAIAILLQKGGAREAPEPLYPALYRVFVTQADHVLWQEAAECLGILRDSLAVAPLGAARKRFQNLDAFPPEIKLEDAAGETTRYSRDERLAQQRAVLSAIGRALEAIAGTAAGR